MAKNILLLTLFFLINSFNIVVCAQDSIIVPNDRKEVSMKKNTVKSAASNLSKSLSGNKSDFELAKEYEKLAEELIKNNEYIKAEDYLKRAKNLYNKNKNKNELININRKLAQINEAKGEIKEAIKNYEEASKLDINSIQSQMSRNDINRLKNSDIKTQSDFAYENVRLIEEKSIVKEEEKVIAYKQLADINKQLNQKDIAIENYEKALSNTKDKKEKIFIKNEIANVYVSDKKYEKAKEVNKELITEAKEIKDTKAEIEQLQSLSDIYLEENDKEKSILLLNEAYDLAIKSGQTIEAKTVLEKLVEIYQKDQKIEKSISLYKNFINNLDNLIKSDSSLVDVKLFQISEEKINQLENERKLQNKLISKQNIINYSLIAIVSIAIIFTIFIFKTLKSIKIRNKKIALQSLRREMNPHFIFNSLNSVNQFIANNNELKANKYLTSYSKLMRNMMENSNKDFIKLNIELEQLKEYLDLEKLRFHDKFIYKINIDENIDTESIYIPNMLIQPNLENSIWHGLRYKEDMGYLELLITQDEKNLNIIISDTGIGLEKSKEIKTTNQKIHKSRGLTNVKERINLLNNIYHININFELKEKEKPNSGVIAKLVFPLMKINPEKNKLLINFITFVL